jgi:pyruvate formate lyase activating enzyme
MIEARHYERFPDGKVQCHLCAHRCTISSGKKGLCHVRENRDGTLYSLVYGIPLSQAVDPIEKKPLFHFYPGSTAYSIATVGCNFRCGFCQNATISQMPRDRGEILGRGTSPQEVVAAAHSSGSQSIAFTYTEPTIFFEYGYDIARLAGKVGISSVYVTNGYMTREVLDHLPGDSVEHTSWLDAANVDLKAFSDATYRSVCGARLQPVLDSLKAMKELGIWVEITTLVVPGMNDSDDELRDIAGFISTDLGAQTPWHVSRFHPDYKMRDRGPTPSGVLQRAYDLGREAGLHYVYVGNMPGARLEDTYCPECCAAVIRRWGFQILEYHLRAGKCAQCATPIAGVGM